MLRFWKNIISTGVDDSFSTKKIKEYRLANTYIISALVVMMLNGFMSWHFNLIELSIGTSISSFGLMFSLFISKKQKILLAEINALFFIFLGIIVAVLFYGEAYCYHYYLILFVVAYIVLFGKRSNKQRNYSIFFTMLLFTLCFFTENGLIGDHVVNPHSVLIISRTNLFLVSATILFFFYVAVLQNRNAEQRLSEIAINAQKEKKAKTDFLSMMSHEIRTPLNAILGVSYLMASDISEEEIQENNNILNSSANNLLQLVNDILDFNKLEANKIELYQNTFNLKELLYGTFKMFEHQAKKKHLDYEFEFDERIVKYVVADSSRINQVISNLLSNAMKFSHQGKVLLKVELIDDSKTSQKIRFVVADEGIGISEQKIDLIFEAFTQSESNTSLDYGGTGLGLAICKMLLELLDSSIVVTSKVGEGSSFQFDLDIIKAPESFEKALIKTKNDDLSHLRLLLAEDNLINQVIMVKFFEKWNAKLYIANNGLEVLDLLKTKTFDLILMDIQMPMMNGIETTRSIRNSGLPYNNMPIIALTADITSEVKDEMFSLGVSEFITKPFEPNKLIDAISRLTTTNLDPA